MKRILPVPIPGGPTLTAGAVECGEEALTVHPPSPSLFEQLLEHLEPLPRRRTRAPDPALLGAGATALCLRWGTYLAVLLDDTRPRDPHAGDEAWSLIAHDEMQRINLEFSANLARVLRWLHEDEDQCVGLLEAAAVKLFLPEHRVRLRRDFLAPYLRVLSDLVWNEEIRSRIDAVLPAVREHPYRVLANSLVLHAYRNGPVEHVHGGRRWSYSVDHCRVTPAESRAIVEFTAGRLAAVFGTFRPWEEIPGQAAAWPEVLAGIAISPWLTARSWSRTEESCPVELPR